MRPTCHLLLAIVFLGLCLSAAPSRDTSRLRWRRQLFQHGTVHDLDSGNFDSTLAALPEGHAVLLEFYASWCPACRLFASTYAEVGQVIGSIPLEPPASAATATAAAAAGSQTSAPAALTPLVARVDCAKEVKLCSSFRVHSYPHVTASTAGSYLQRKVAAVRAYPSRAQRSKQEIVRWAAYTLQLPMSQTSMAAAGIHTLTAPSLARGAPAFHNEKFVWTMADVESTTLYLYRQVIMADPARHTGRDKRAALRALLQLWAAGHPSPQCRGPSQVLIAFFDASWPESEDVAPEKIRDYRICGNTSEPEKWVACAGSSPGARGFTCGLWLLFHTCAHRLPYDGERGVVLITALKAFNDHFFPCQVCQKHFAKVLDAPEAKAVRTQSQASLWLWRVHNEVNMRLRAIETQHGHSSSGDPAHPKRRFPSARACPRCRKAAAGAANVSNSNPAAAGLSSNGGGDEDAAEPDWDLQEVYEYLEKTFMIESQPPNTPMHLRHEWAWARPLPYIIGSLSAVVALLLLLVFGCNAMGQGRRVHSGGAAGGGRGRWHNLKGPMI